MGGVALWKSGKWLVREDAFEHVRWGLVLAGESRDCERSDAAIRMYHDAKIDTLIISSTRIFKNRYQSEFMVDYYVQQGVPRTRVFEFRQDAYSTLEEARLLVRQFRYQNLDTVLIITSSFHTARTRRIFRKLAQGYPVVLVASAEYNVYDPNAWWSNRESRKIWFEEWAKTVFTWFELAKAPPENGKAEYQGLVPDVWASRASGEPTRPESFSLPDTATHPSALKSDTGAVQLPAPPPASVSAQDSGKETRLVPDQGESKSTAADTLLASKTDSAKAHKDSLKTAAGKTLPEPKTATKDSVARKTLPRAEKPAASSSKETKRPSTPVKGPYKPVEKRTEHSKPKK